MTYKITLIPADDVSTVNEILKTVVEQKSCAPFTRAAAQRILDQLAPLCRLTGDTSDALLTSSARKPA
ncbi:MAG: hypothetical protein HY646_19870 [Acidobacteria bacterium]|nr:hypothetical protein [Acidobacteriota bacterium]